MIQGALRRSPSFERCNGGRDCVLLAGAKLYFAEQVARKYTDNCPVDSVKAQFEDGRDDGRPVGRRAPYCTLSVAL